MASAGAADAEVWDDSSLINSWNEALEEYKKYHSLAVKGEMVKLEHDEPQETESPKKTDAHVQAGEASVNDTSASANAPIVASPMATIPTVNASAPSMPQVVMGTVQNDDMKNLMMSWYYAGYYTGLLEGKQQGYATAIAQQPQG